LQARLQASVTSAHPSKVDTDLPIRSATARVFNQGCAR